MSSQFVANVTVSLRQSLQTSWSDGDLEDWSIWAQHMRTTIQAVCPNLNQLAARFEAQENTFLLGQITRSTSTSLEKSTRTSWKVGELEDWSIWARRMRTTIETVCSILEVISAHLAAQESRITDPFLFP